MGASRSFGDEIKPPGKQHRGGTLGEAIDDLRADIDDAFVSLEGSTGGMAVATWDFAVDGGAQGAIILADLAPANTYVVKSWYRVETTLTSATDAATVKLGLVDDDATIKAAVAISDVSNPWDAGLHDGDNDGTAANASTLTAADKSLVMTIAVEDLTAGKLIVYAEYLPVPA